MSINRTQWAYRSKGIGKKNHIHTLQSKEGIDRARREWHEEQGTSKIPSEVTLQFQLLSFLLTSCVCVQTLSVRVWLFATLWAVACQAPPSMGSFHARILEWVAISFSRGSSRPRDRTRISFVSFTGRWILYHCATWEEACMYMKAQKSFDLHLEKDAIFKDEIKRVIILNFKNVHTHTYVHTHTHTHWSTNYP